jgi:tetrahydromethanopterin S-methyltransferase subunit F
MSSINKNPAQFGGRGLALGGMITGGIGLAIGIIYWILVILGTFAQNL